jgi:hypothetical protein
VVYGIVLIILEMWFCCRIKTLWSDISNLLIAVIRVWLYLKIHSILILFVFIKMILMILIAIHGWLLRKTLKFMIKLRNSSKIKSLRSIMLWNIIRKSINNLIIIWKYVAKVIRNKKYCLSNLMRSWTIILLINSMNNFQI